MNSFIGIGIAALILVIIFTIVPLIGSEMDDAVTVPAGSQWNATTNDEIVTGYDLWGSIGGIIKVGAFIAVVVVFVAGVYKMKQN
jgi:Fe2+ transport system protein B